MKKHALFLSAFFMMIFGLVTASVHSAHAQSASNLLFPVTVQSVLGKNYVSRALPAPTEYSSPLKKLIGRYFDGHPDAQNTTSMGFYWRFLAGGAPVFSSQNRVYVRLRSTIAAYNTGNFISRLTTGPLSFFKGTYFNGSYQDGILPWDAYFYPEEGGTNGWLQEACDCNDNLHSFDADDRGYLYLAHRFGIGIIRDNGASLSPVSQIRGIGGITFPDGPKTLPFFMSGSHGSNKITDAGGAGSVLGISQDVRVLRSGSQYFLVSQESNTAHLFNVTDPLNPVYLRALPGEGVSKAKIAQSGGLVAVQKSDSVWIYSIATYTSPSGGDPVIKFPAGVGKYVGLAADKTGTFFSIYYNGKSRGSEASISVLTSTAEKKQSTGVGFEAKILSYNKGYLTSVGALSDGSAEDIKIWVFQSGVPVELGTKGFVQRYYDVNDEITNASVESIGGKDYLFLSTLAISDVYELEPVSRDNAAGGPTADTGCAAGNKFSTTTGNPCACVLSQKFPLGTRSEEVRLYQQMLKDTGYLAGKVDGIYGPITANAAFLYCRSVEHPVYQNTNIIYATAKPPVISSVDGPRTLGSNELGTWIANAADANMDDLSWSVDWGEGRSVQTCKLNPAPGTGQGWIYSASHAWTDKGSHTVTIYASDCKGGTTKNSFTVNVQ